MLCMVALNRVSSYGCCWIIQYCLASNVIHHWLGHSISRGHQKSLHHWTSCYWSFSTVFFDHILIKYASKSVSWHVEETVTCWTRSRLANGAGWVWFPRSWRPPDPTQPATGQVRAGWTQGVQGGGYSSVIYGYTATLDGSITQNRNSKEKICSPASRKLGEVLYCWLVVRGWGLKWNATVTGNNREA